MLKICIYFNLESKTFDWAINLLASKYYLNKYDQITKLYLHQNILAPRGKGAKRWMLYSRDKYIYRPRAVMAESEIYSRYRGVADYFVYYILIKQRMGNIPLNIMKMFRIGNCVKTQNACDVKFDSNVRRFIRFYNAFYSIVFFFIYFTIFSYILYYY